MNSVEVYHIKKTWEIPAANPTDSGVAILTTFFTKYPSNLEKFPSFKDIPVSELKTNARFRAHAVRIIKVFDESVQSLGHDWSKAKLEEIWSGIADSHLKRRISSQSYMELREAILEVLTAVCELNEQQMAAWVKVLDIVYSLLFRKLERLERAEQQ